MGSVGFVVFWGGVGEWELSHGAKIPCREGINVPDVNVNGNLTAACGSVLGPKIWERPL